MDIDIPTHVRFHPKLYDDTIKWVANAKHIIAREFGKQHGNEHYHLILYKKVTLDAVRKYYQRLCKAHGLQTDKGQANSWYGGVKLFPTNGPQYVCKEGKIVSTKGFDASAIEQYIIEGKNLFRKQIPLIVVNDDSAPLDVEYVYAIQKKEKTFIAKVNEYCEAFFAGPSTKYKTTRQIRTWLKIHQVNVNGCVDAQASNQRIVDTIYIKLHNCRTDNIGEVEEINLG